MTRTDGAGRRRRPTIVDVANEAGVSKSAVSRALLGQGEVSEPARRRIEEAAQRLGYVVNAMARGLVSAQTKTLGVVLRDVKKPYYAYLQAGVQSRAVLRDYRIVTTTNAGAAEVEDALREITNLIALRVDGLIIAPARLPSARYAGFVERIPIVVAGRRETLGEMSSVACDDPDGGTALARHLLRLGHRRIAVLLVDQSYSDSHHARARAMIDAIRSASGSPTVWAIPTDRDAAAVLAAHLGGADVTAIMCPTDECAMDALEVLRERGDAALTTHSVTGYGGIGPLALPYLGLTTFRLPQEEIGRTAVDLLVDRIEGRTSGERYIAVRGSVVAGRTARPPR